MGVSFAQLPAVIVRYLLTIQITDLLDIAIMVFVLYKVLMLVQSTKAASLVKGLLVFLAALALSSFFHLNGINYIMSKMVEWGVLALIILFQPEIRRVLEQMGSRRFIAFSPMPRLATPWTLPLARLYWLARRCPSPAPVP